MDPLYLVDGSGYVFRAFYAVQPLSNSRGLPTNALFGFYRMLQKLLRDVEAKYIAVAFDRAEPTFRHQMYSEYKANRKECPSELIPQLPYFRKLVEAFSIKSLEMPGVEADDIIATIALKVRETKHDVIIVSGDKDLCQLVGDHIVVWDAMRDIKYDRAGVVNKFGVAPEQIRDYLALVGDTSDNVPGIPGVGPKTAVQLLSAFNSLEAILSNPQGIEEIKGLRGAKRIREAFESGAQNVRLSSELVSLKADVKPFNSVESVEEFAWSEPSPTLLPALLEELEFKDNLGRVRRETPTASKRFVAVTPESFPDFLLELKTKPSFGFDTETTGLDPLTCELVGISISWKSGEGYYLPFIAPDGNLLNREMVLNELRPIFESSSIKKFGSNLKFDVRAMKCAGVAVRGVAFDTMIASYVLHPDRRQHGLKTLAKTHLAEEMVTFEELAGKSLEIAKVPLAQVVSYASHDAEAALRITQILEGELSVVGQGGKEVELGIGKKIQPSLRAVFEEIEMPLVTVLAEMEDTGIKVSSDRLGELATEFSREISMLEESIYELAGCRFNLNSPKQLSAILFERLALPTAGVKKTQSSFSTDASVLEGLDHPVAKKILEYREIFKLQSTYVDALSRLIHPKTGRIHTCFNQTVAATGRLSSSDPNLQNIPVKNERGRRIRAAFVAETGNKLISADYSQIELRVLAHLSQDENLCRAFINDEDIHLATARELFGADRAHGEEESTLRRIAKTINFGVVYGMGAFRLGGDLGVSRKQAQEFIDNYFGRYPRVRKFFDELAASSETKGYVETMFGRRRYRAELDVSGRDPGYAQRSLLNAPIQGTAAEIIKIAMIALYDALKPYGAMARLILQVHDELIVEADASVVDEVKLLVTGTMEQAVKLAVPVKVDATVSDEWS